MKSYSKLLLKNKSILDSDRKERCHVVTVLLHDYFHRHVFKKIIGEKQWDRFESRMERNVDETINLLGRFNIKATFFTLGWIAERKPEIIKKLVAYGHEIASAGYEIRSVKEMGPDRFREDLRRARRALEKAGSNRILGYRCAYQWIGNKDLWALDILSEEGYKYDASYKPPMFSLTLNSSYLHTQEMETRTGVIWEFPVSISHYPPLNFPISGGGYLRHFPHRLMLQEFHRWCKKTEAPFVLYFHPWELDTEQPRISLVGKISMIKQYRNLGVISRLLPTYFEAGQFQSISQYLDIHLDYPDLSAEELEDHSSYNIERNAEEGRKEVTIIIPMFNESLSLYYLRRALDELVMAAQNRFEIRFVFVDDGSTDNTYEQLVKWFGTREDCKILRHTRNQGIAGALSTGFQAADTEIVCSMDADCSYDPLELLKMIPLLEDGVDLVTASPYHRDGAVRNVPRWRLFLSKSLSRLYHVLLHHKLATYTSCLRVYRKRSVVNLDIQNTGFLGIAELIAKLDIHGGTVREHPTVLESRIFGQSKMQVFQTIKGHCRLLLTMMNYRRKFAKKRPQTKFKSLQPIYYWLKPFIPRRLLIQIRRQIILRKREKWAHIWPIDEKSGRKPEGWSSWPDGKKFALVLTHDVETERGLEKVVELAKLEKQLGFRSSFNLVAEDYRVPPMLIKHLRDEGFEVGLHGLSHTGNLFRSKKWFRREAIRINHHLREWRCEGFRAPSMYHNLDWIGDLNIQYDSSTFDTDPFEPQPDGVSTIFPFWVSGNSGREGYVELPYTLPQDFTLFVLMCERDNRVWKEKLDWIAEKGGMALLITHPDFMNFEGNSMDIESYPIKYYLDFLEYVASRYQDCYCQALPHEVGVFIASHFRFPREEKQFRQKKMKACMLSYSFYENDNRVMRYAETLAERGDKVDVIALRKERQPEFETMNGVNVYRVQERILDERGKFSYLHRMVRFFYNSSILLSKLHLKDPYQLIHVHSVPDFEVFAGLFAKLSGAKIILDIHDLVPEFYESKFHRKNGGLVFKVLTIIERASVAFSDHVIISNHLWEKKILSRSVAKDKCTVILNYPDPRLFHPRPKKKKDERLIFLYPGTLNWHQGLDIAIQAFSAIREQVPEAELHIYGRGSEINRLQEMVVSLDLTERIILKPSIPISKIADVMADADIGIVPKRNDPFGGEAFSTKILEFMLLGVPVIVAKTKIDSYYFKDSVVKFFEPENVDDLAKSMLELSRNRELRETISQNASKFVEDLSWERKKWIYLNLVDSITGNHVSK